MDDEPTSSGKSSEQAELIGLLMRNRHKIFSYIFSLIPNRTDAEDVFQNVSAVVWSKLDEFEPGTDFLAWVNRIAYWEVRAARQKFSRSKIVFDDELLAKVSASSVRVDEEDGGDRAEALRVCLSKLDPKERDFLLRRYEAGADVSEAAKSVGRSIQAAYKALTRLRRTLFHCVTEELAR